MKIRILTIGQKMPAWVLTGFEDYFKRIQPFVQTQVLNSQWQNAVKMIQKQIF